jgi:hypothetical protein
VRGVGTAVAEMNQRHGRQVGKLATPNPKSRFLSLNPYSLKPKSYILNLGYHDDIEMCSRNPTQTLNLKPKTQNSLP